MGSGNAAAVAGSGSARPAGAQDCQQTYGEAAESHADGGAGKLRLSACHG